MKYFFLAFTTLLAGFTLLTVPVQAQISTDEACRGANFATDGAVCEEAPFLNTFRRIVNTIIFIVGAVSVLMVIIGGLRYVLSGGDREGVEGAKNQILYAVVGLVVAFLAFAIVNFVLSRLENQPESASLDNIQVARLV